MKNKKLFSIIIGCTLMFSIFSINRVAFGTDILTTTIAKYVTNYKELPSATVDKEKTFTINFNKDINKATVNRNTIKVLDSTGKEVNVSVVTRIDNNKVAQINAPIGGYVDREKYTLIVTKGVLDIQNKPLGKEIIMKFVIEGDNQSTTMKRINSVNHAKGTLVNNNSYADKKYNKLIKSEMLDKTKVYMTHMVSEYGINYFTVDYSKSLNAFSNSNFDILDSVNMDLDKKDGSVFTLEFGTDIDKSSLVYLDTLHIIPINNTSEHNFDLEHSYGNEIDIISVDKGSVKLKLRSSYSGNAKFLFINGVKDTKGNYIKPTVFPIWGDNEVSRKAKNITVDGIYFRDLTPQYEGKIPEHYGNPIGVIGKKADIYNTHVYTLATWSSVEDGFKKYCPDNMEILKEVRNRMFKYSFMYESLYKSSIFPSENSSMKIWDRFVVDGKQVEVTFLGWDITITIYNKGDAWNTKYNVVGLVYNIAYTDPKRPALSWGYNFNSKYFNRFKYEN